MKELNMNEFKTMGELVSKVFNVGNSAIWEVTKQLRFVKRKNGTTYLQQLWAERSSGKTEWRDVPMEQEDAE